MQVNTLEYHRTRIPSLEIFSSFPAASGEKNCNDYLSIKLYLLVSITTDPKHSSSTTSKLSTGTVCSCYLHHLQISLPQNLVSVDTTTGVKVLVHQSRQSWYHVNSRAEVNANIINLQFNILFLNCSPGIKTSSIKNVHWICHKP